MITALLLALVLTGDVTADARLTAGTVISADHISGAPEDVAGLVGMQVTRTIFPGRTITVSDVRPADLVGRNDIVRIIGRHGPLTVETRGRSLGAGPMGAEIMVMNLESRRTVMGRVVGPSTVEVDI